MSKTDNSEIPTQFFDFGKADDQPINVIPGHTYIINVVVFSEDLSSALVSYETNSGMQSVYKYLWRGSSNSRVRTPVGRIISRCFFVHIYKTK